jgi:hypothetical protein
MSLTFYCDRFRHLVCVPYTVENLYKMAEALGIKRCWFHNSKNHPHYDIPKRRIQEIEAKVEVVSYRDILRIMHGQTSGFPANDGEEDSRDLEEGARVIEE